MANPASRGFFALTSPADASSVTDIPVDVDPDALRRRLRPAGHTALSVVITRLGTGADGHAVAFVCRPSS